MSAGKRMRELRESMGLSIVDMAERIGFGAALRPWLSAIEHGRRNVPGTYERVESMASGLGVPVATLQSYLAGRLSLRAMRKEMKL